MDYMTCCVVCKLWRKICGALKIMKAIQFSKQAPIPSFSRPHLISSSLSSNDQYDILGEETWRVLPNRAAHGNYITTISLLSAFDGTVVKKFSIVEYIFDFGNLIGGASKEEMGKFFLGIACE